MTVTEPGIAFEFLYTTLSSDALLDSYAPGGVWRSLVQPSTVPPYILIIYQSGMDVITSRADRLMDSLLYQIKVVGPASMTTTLINASTQIDVLLGRTSGTATGGLILACWRESPLQQDELVNGELWTNIGGLYRLQIQQTS